MSYQKIPISEGSGSSADGKPVHETKSSNPANAYEDKQHLKRSCDGSLFTDSSFSSESSERSERAHSVLTKAGSCLSLAKSMSESTSENQKKSNLIKAVNPSERQIPKKLTAPFCPAKNDLSHVPSRNATRSPWRNSSKITEMKIDQLVKGRLSSPILDHLCSNEGHSNAGHGLSLSNNLRQCDPVFTDLPPPNLSINPSPKR